MSNFLTRLVNRTHGLSEVVQPVTKPIFTSEVAVGGGFSSTPPLDKKNSDLKEKIEFTQPPGTKASSTGAEPTTINPVTDKDTIPEKSLDSNRIGDIHPNPKNKTLVPIDNQQLDANTPPISNKKVIKELHFHLKKTKSLSSKKTIKDIIPKQTETPEGNILSDEPNIGNVRSHKEKALSIQSPESNTLIKKVHISDKEEHSLVPTYYKGNIRPYGSDYLEKTIGAMVDGYSEKRGAASTPPTIKVTIGRIDVRAVMQQAPSPQRRTAPPKPKLKLDDYLKQRNGGQR